MGYMRGFLAKLQYKFALFMQGRYGPDQLYRALLVVYAVVLVLHLLTRWWPLSILEWLILVWMLFRCFSKNTIARQKEIAAWLRLEGRVRSFWRLTKNRWRDRHTHVYRHCPHCKVVVRLPRSKKGDRVCNCPHCRRDFPVKIR